MGAAENERNKQVSRQYRELSSEQQHLAISALCCPPTALPERGYRGRRAHRNRESASLEVCFAEKYK